MTSSSCQNLARRLNTILEKPLKQPDDKESWPLLFRQVGAAIYSLHCAELHWAHAEAMSHNAKDQGNDARIQMIQMNEVIRTLADSHNLPPVERFAKQLRSYFLKSAEMRIASSFDRSLKLYDARKDDRRDIVRLIQAVLDKRRSKPRLRVEIILKDFRPYRFWTDHNHQSDGESLKCLFVRVNHLKHDPKHRTIEIPPTVRFNECCNGCRAVMDLLEEFGHELEIWI